MSEPEFVEEFFQQHPLLEALYNGKIRLFVVAHNGGEGGDFFTSIASMLLPGCINPVRLPLEINKWGQCYSYSSLLQNRQLTNAYTNYMDPQTVPRSLIVSFLYRMIDGLDRMETLYRRDPDRWQWAVVNFHPDDINIKYEDIAQWWRTVFPNCELVTMNTQTKHGKRWLNNAHSHMSNAKIVQKTALLANSRTFDVGHFTREDFDNVLKWFDEYSVDTDNVKKARNEFERYISSRVWNKGHRLIFDNEMDWSGNTIKLQVDMTSYCNAKCGGCARNISGGPTLPGLKLTHFDVDVWTQLSSSIQQIQKLTLNGNWGDPAMHPKLHEMMQTWIKYNPRSHVAIHTNGGSHKPEWWAELARILQQTKSHRIFFAVDGLDDTHSIYRRNVDYTRLIENIQAFTDAGGHAVWCMTLFDHNIHQIEQAKQIADSIGVDMFQTRHSHTPDELYIVDKDENVQYTIYNQQAREVETDPGEWLPNARDKTIRKYRDPDITGTTKCPWYNAKDIQIDPWGRVWPCCNMSVYGVGHPEFPAEDFDTSVLPENFNSLHHHDIYNILQHDWFTTTLSKDVQTAKHAVCRRVCGVA